MKSWLVTVIDVVPILLAAMAVTVVLALGARPKKHNSWRAFFRSPEDRRKLFPEGFLPGLITFVVGVILMLAQLFMQGRLYDARSARLSPRPDMPTITSWVSVTPIARSVPRVYTATFAFTPTHTSTATSTWTPIPVTLASNTPTPTSSPTATSVPTATYKPTSTPTATPTRVPPACTGYAQITEPHPGDIISQDFTIRGSAYLPPGVKTDPPREFSYYVIQYMRLREEPGTEQQWIFLTSSIDPVSAGSGELGKFPMTRLTNRGYSKGTYAIRLRVVDNTGNYDDDVYPDCIIEVTLVPPVPEH